MIGGIKFFDWVHLFLLENVHVDDVTLASSHSIKEPDQSMVGLFDSLHVHLCIAILIEIQSEEILVRYTVSRLVFQNNMASCNNINDVLRTC